MTTLTCSDHATPTQFATNVHAAVEQYGSMFGCPIYFALELIRRKWAIQIIYGLFLTETPTRFNQLERALTPITQKELTKRLRELESAGLVQRTVYPEVPPRVEYTLTERGRDLVPALETLTHWGRQHFRERV